MVGGGGRQTPQHIDTEWGRCIRVFANPSKGVGASLEKKILARLQRDQQGDGGVVRRATTRGEVGENSIGLKGM